MASKSPTDTTPAEWTVTFCAQFAPTIFDFARYFLWAALVLGVLVAVIAVLAAALAAYKEWKSPTAANPGVAAANAAPPTGILDAIKGFIEALAKAPAWLALFGGGALLLWMAAFAVPDYCKS